MAATQMLNGFSETSLYILSMSLIHTRWSKCLLFNPVIFTDHLCQAGKLLELPRLSLAWLLQNYCNLSGDKQFQLADWRIRLDIFFACQGVMFCPQALARGYAAICETGYQTSTLHLLQVYSHCHQCIAM